ncbi:MAG: serine/threonine protein kinase, partial [Planctomycetales bacterium]|nr:serine/threonine protein kinase [Planctomycetales bacterium]
MSVPSSDSAQRLAETLRQLPPGDRREALERHSTGDAGLKSAVETLLAEDLPTDGAPPPAAAPAETLSIGAAPSVAPTQADPSQPRNVHTDETLVAPPGGHAGRRQTSLRFGDYEVLEELGKGGMGVVYRARQISADRTVALKLIRPDRLAGFADDQRTEALARFRNEVQAAARIEHENVIPVYDVGEVDGAPFYVMRYVDGTSLIDFCRSEPIDNQRAARYVLQIARAIERAHALGILHRDLKPHNVMVDAQNDRAMLADFGLAKLTQAEQQLTATEAIFGSPPYMSPEQAKDAGRVTTATDVYGLGAVLYQLISGRAPFVGAKPVEIVMQVLSNEPTPPRILNPHAARDLETIALK